MHAANHPDTLRSRASIARHGRRRGLRRLSPRLELPYHNMAMRYKHQREIMDELCHLHVDVVDALGCGSSLAPTPRTTRRSPRWPPTHSSTSRRSAPGARSTSLAKSFSGHWSPKAEWVGSTAEARARSHYDKCATSPYHQKVARQRGRSTHLLGSPQPDSGSGGGPGVAVDARAPTAPRTSTRAE